MKLAIMQLFFLPLISQFSFYKDLDSALPGKMPVAERVAEQVICLPIYPDLDRESIVKITNLLNH